MDSISAELDTSGMPSADAIAAVQQRHVNAGSHVSADAIRDEAKARLRRQLGPDATGATAAGITDRPAFDGNGYVVLSEREPFPNLPIWIEKGTKKGKPGSHRELPRPYFYVSVDLQRGAHERIIADELQAASNELGMGD